MDDSFSLQDEPGRPTETHFGSLFLDDVATFGVPYLSSVETLFSVQPPMGEAQSHELLTLLQTGWLQPTTDLSSALSDFIRDALQRLVQESPVWYIAERDESTRLVPVPPRGWHIDPPDLVVRSGIDSARVRVQIADAVRLELPPEYPGATFDRFWAAVQDLDQMVSPQWFMDDLVRGRQSPFDATQHIRSHTEALASASREFGWPARGSFDGIATEYFTVITHIRFRKFLAELRESVLTQLTAQLTRLGLLPDETRIEQEGLQTVEVFEEAERRLERGEITFRDAVQEYLVAASLTQ